MSEIIKRQSAVMVIALSLVLLTGARLLQFMSSRDTGKTEVREMEFSQMLFYGGNTAIIALLVLCVLAVAIFKVRFSKLKRLLDLEYGKQNGKTVRK